MASLTQAGGRDPRPQPRAATAWRLGPAVPQLSWAAMLRISVFYGIVISMRWREHGPPHFHAAYGDAEASIGISPLAVLRSTMMPRQLGLVMEWAALHQGELAANWGRAENHSPLAPIQPLA